MEDTVTPEKTPEKKEEKGHECGKTCGCSVGKEQFLGVKVYPGQVLKWKGRKPLPNDRCHCGSGKKFKKCCGR